jgi:hypothetical protein
MISHSNYLSPVRQLNNSAKHHFNLPLFISIQNLQCSRQYIMSKEVVIGGLERNVTIHKEGVLFLKFLFLISTKKIIEERFHGKRHQTWIQRIAEYKTESTTEHKS